MEYPRGPVVGPSGRASVSLRLTLIALAFASAVGGWSCGHGEAAPVRPRTVAEAVRQVYLGQTTPSDIEQRFGVAYEADG